MDSVNMYTYGDANADEMYYFPLKENNQRRSKVKDSAVKSMAGKATVCKYMRHTTDTILSQTKLGKQEDIFGMDDGGLLADNSASYGGRFLYSLNKKGRWKLATAVPTVADSCLKVTICESQLRPDDMGTKPAVTAYHTTDETGVSTHRYPKKTFATMASLGQLQQNQSSRHRSKNAAKLQRTSTSDNGVQRSKVTSNLSNKYSVTEVVFELHVPSKSTALYEHAVEKGGTRSAAHSGGDAITKSSSKKSCKAFRIDARNDEYIPEADFPVCDDQNNEGDENYGFPEFYGTTRSDSYNIMDFVVPSITVDGSKSKKSAKKAKKRNALYATDELWSNQFFVDRKDSFIEDIDEQVIQDLEAAATEPTIDSTDEALPEEAALFEIIPIELQIHSDTLTPKFLKETYGENYYEVECIPRRFVIDISTTVVESLHSRSFSFSATANSQQYFCVFEVVEPVIAAASAYEISICRVWLNGTFSRELNSIFLETINPWPTHPMEEVVQAARQFLDMIPVESLKPHNFAKQACFSNPVVRGLLLPVQCTVECLNVDEVLIRAFQELAQLPNDKQLLSPNSISPVINQPIDKLCVVCFEETSLGWALAQCKHWLCQTCWNRFLLDQISKGITPLSCPDFNCGAKVSYRLLTTVIPLPQCKNYAELVLEQFCAKNADQWTRCPNASCGCVVRFKLNQLPEIVLSCACDTVWCGTCGEKNHWPASCAQAKLYWDLLRHYGELVVSAAAHPESQIQRVRVKQCPFCKTLMERHYGCNRMLCMCGHEFCWNCAKPWSNHYSCTVKPEVADTVYQEKTLVDVSLLTVELHRSKGHITDRRLLKALTKASAHSERASLRFELSPLEVNSPTSSGKPDGSAAAQSDLFKSSWYEKCIYHHKAAMLSLKQAETKSHCWDLFSSLPYGQWNWYRFVLFHRQTHALIEYTYVWLCFANFGGDRLKTVVGLLDRLHFLLLRIDDAGEAGITSSDNILRAVRISECLVKQLLEIKKMEYTNATMSS